MLAQVGGETIGLVGRAGRGIGDGGLALDVARDAPNRLGDLGDAVGRLLASAIGLLEADVGRACGEVVRLVLGLLPGFGQRALPSSARWSQASWWPDRRSWWVAFAPSEVPPCGDSEQRNCSPRATPLTLSATNGLSFAGVPFDSGPALPISVTKGDPMPSGWPRLTGTSKSQTRKDPFGARPLRWLPEPVSAAAPRPARHDATVVRRDRGPRGCRRSCRASPACGRRRRPR